VGIMRNGRILEEGSPSELTAKFNQQTLEDVFLYLCKVGNVAVKDESNDVATIRVAEDSSRTEMPPDDASNRSNEEDSSWGNFGRNVILNLWILSVLIRKNLTRFFQFNI